MEELAWKLNYREETLTGQTGVRKWRRKCPGFTERHRVDHACVWGTTDR